MEDSFAEIQKRMQRLHKWCRVIVGMQGKECKFYINDIQQPRNQGGNLGHLPPKFSKHCIAILAFVETFQ